MGIVITIVVMVFGVKFIGLKDPKNQTKQSVEVSQGAKPSLAVETTRAKAVDWPQILMLNGAVYPWQEAQISAELGGVKLREVNADVGDQVKKGQTLAVLADETILADLHKQQATVERDKASLAEASSNAQRAKEIENTGALSAQKINEYLIAEQTAKATLALSMAELEQQQIKVKQTRIIASDDGLISSRTATLGNVVSAGSELFKLIRQGRLEWRGEINANQLALLKRGDAVQLILPNQSSVTGKVRLISPTVDTNSRNALVYVDITSANVKPGMYLQGNITVGSQAGFAVPLSSVVYRDGHSYVFEIGEVKNGIAQVNQRKIQTGRTRDEAIEVVSGLSQEAEVVVTGGAFLKDGDRVSIVNTNRSEPSNNTTLENNPLSKTQPLSKTKEEK